MSDVPDSLEWWMKTRIPAPPRNASFDEHLDYLSRMRRHEEEYAVRQAREVCESPIEELVYLYLWHELTQGHLRFWPQKEIGPYRVDFYVELEDRKLIIECDGHDFHEKTKRQAARDKKRDRYLTAEGYTVLRFTGSEIVKNPAAVISEMNDVVYSEMVRRDFGY